MVSAYVLRSKKTGFLYKGITNNIGRRLEEHNDNKNKGTRGNGPWELIYFEEFPTRAEARKRETYFKSGAGREYLRKLNIPR